MGVTRPSDAGPLAPKFPERRLPSSLAGLLVGRAVPNSYRAVRFEGLGFRHANFPSGSEAPDHREKWHGCQASAHTCVHILFAPAGTMF